MTEKTKNDHGEDNAHGSSRAKIEGSESRTIDEQRQRQTAVARSAAAGIKDEWFDEYLVAADDAEHDDEKGRWA